MRRLPNIQYVLTIVGDCPPLVVHRGVAESEKTGEARQRLWQRKAVQLSGVTVDRLTRTEPESISIVDSTEDQEAKPWLLKFLELPDPSILDRLLEPLGLLPGCDLSKRLQALEIVHLPLGHGKALQADLAFFAQDAGYRYIIGPRPAEGKGQVVIHPVVEIELGYKITISAQAREVMRARGLVLITCHKDKPIEWSAARIKREAATQTVI